MPSIKNYVNRQSLLNNIGLLVFSQSNLQGDQYRYDFGTYSKLNFNNISCIIFPGTTVSFYNDNLDSKNSLLNSVSSDASITVINSYINKKCQAQNCNITRIYVTQNNALITQRNKVMNNLCAIYFPKQNFKGELTLLYSGN